MGAKQTKVVPARPSKLGFEPSTPLFFCLFVNEVSECAGHVEHRRMLTGLITSTWNDSCQCKAGRSRARARFCLGAAAALTDPLFVVERDLRQPRR